MNQKEKDARKRLAELQRKNGDDGYTTKKGAGFGDHPGLGREGTIKDGPIRRVLGIKPKGMR
jgi:hypothetical protein